jgi:hypothetical protein
VRKVGSTGIRTQVARIRTLSDNQLHYGTMVVFARKKMKCKYGGTDVSPFQSKKKGPRSQDENHTSQTDIQKKTTNNRQHSAKNK